VIDPIAVSPPPVSETRLHHGMTPADAAREFETMLLAAWMKTAREAGEIDDKEDEMTGAESYLEFAEKYVAEAIAQGRAFGFAEMIAADLRQQANAAPPSPETPEARFPDTPPYRFPINGR
jgi:Rod binding domain-containing protein